MRLGGKGLHQDKNSCRFGRAKRVVDTAGSADRAPPPPLLGPTTVFATLPSEHFGGRDRGERRRRCLESRVEEVGGRQKRNPRAGPATCADPPSLCAGWGRRGTRQDPVPGPPGETGQGTAGRPRSSGVPFGTTLAGNLGTGRDRAPGTPELPFRGSPREKPKRGGRQGAPDPPGFHSGSPSGKLKRREDPPEPLGFCSGSLQRETRARRRRVPSGSPGLPFGVLPAKKHGEAPGSRRRRSRRPGSGGIPGCGPAA